MVATEKSKQRAILKKRLAEIKGREKKNAQIRSYVIGSDEFLRAESIFVYVSTDDEVDTLGIIADSLNRGKRVYVPVCDGEAMLAARITESSEFAVGRYGIFEPINKEFYDGEIALAVIPTLGFDGEKNRLGHGKGYYDRFLVDRKTFKMCVAYSEQRLAAVATEATDVKMDAVITEEGEI